MSGLKVRLRSRREHPLRELAMRIGTGLLVVALAGGCGSAAGAGSAGAGATAPLSGGSHSAASGAGTTDLGVQSINMFVYASAADINAANQFRGTLFWVRDTLTARCLSKQGFRYTPQSAEELGNFDVNSIFPDLDRMKATGLFGSGANLDHVVDPAASVPAAQKPAFNQAALACQKQANTQLAPVLKPGRTLGGQWNREVDKVMSEAPVTTAMASFSTCIQKQGVPASSSQDLLRFLAWTEGEMSRTQNDAEYRAAQRKWTTAFVPCATPVVQAIDDQLAPRKQQFLQTHLDLVHQLQSAVDSTLPAVRNQLNASN